MRKPAAQAFNLSINEENSMNYLQFYNLSDIMLSESFEGLKKRRNFSELEWSLIRNTQEVLLVNCFTPDVRTLWITKKLRTAVAAMQSIVAKYLNGTNTENDLKYLIHSSHDT